MDNKLKKLDILNDYLVSLIPNEFESRDKLVFWLNKSPYSPYISLYGGENSLLYEKRNSFTSEIDGQRRYRIDDVFSFKFENFQNFNSLILSANTRLYNILNSNELFQAYPEFADIEVNISISNSNNGYMSGANHFLDNRIDVFADSNESAMRVLLHELQHSIQIKEGFAIGRSYYGDDGVMDLFVGTDGTDLNSFSDLATQKSMVEIDDSEAKVNTDGLKKLWSQGLRGEGQILLSDIFEHPKLFEIYPELKNIDVIFGKGIENASFDGVSIYLNSDKYSGFDFEKTKSSLLHELQHSIQDIENWAKGGNVDLFKDVDLSKIKKEDTLKEIRNYIDFNFNGVDGNYRRAIRMINSGDDIEKGTNIIQDNALYKAEYADYIRAYQDLIEIENTNYEVDILTKYEQYRSLWGEQQARSTQYRLGMTEKERRDESWTETLQRVEGEYSEPIIKFDGLDIANAIELEERYLDENGMVDEDLILKDGVSKLPRYFTGYSKFEKLFKNKISNRYALLNTPVGDVKIHMRSAFDHFKNNTNKTNRTRYSGGLIPAFTDPLFVVKDVYQGKNVTVFYKPMVSKKKQEGLMHFAGYGVNDKGEIEHSTYFDITKGRLKKYIKIEEDNLLYFKHAGSRLERACSDNVSTTEETRAYDGILSKNDSSVKKNTKELCNTIENDREANFKEWFGDSKVVDGDGEPLVVYHGTNKEFSFFNKKEIGSNYKADEFGFFFTSSPDEASDYANGTAEYHKDGNANVIPTHLKMENPYIIEALYCNAHQMYDSIGNDIEFKQAIESGKYDGVIVKNIQADEEQLKESWRGANEGGNLYMVFEPSQIKSIHNKGTFDIDNPNILEKNDYGMRQIEKILSIVPDGMGYDDVKDYLSFNGVDSGHLIEYGYDNVLKNGTFDSSLLNFKGTVDTTSDYYQSGGEIESRHIEDLYVNHNKIDDISIEEAKGVIADAIKKDELEQSAAISLK